MDTNRGDRLWTLLFWTALLTLVFAWKVLQSNATPASLLAIPLWALLLLLFLGAGWVPGVRALTAWLEEAPGRVYALPLMLAVLFLGYAGGTGHLVGREALLGLAFLLLPVEMAWRDRRSWRDSDMALAWGALLIPLLAGPLQHDMGLPANVLLRVGAFLLPAFFLWLARGKWTGIRFILGVLYVWYSVEFGGIPRVGFPMVGLFKLYAIILVLYMALISGYFEELGFGLSLRWQETLVALREFAYFLPLGLGIGILTGFLQPHLIPPSLTDALSAALGIFFFTGIPEELLFRGILHRFIARYVANPQRALVLSSLLFGASHLDNPPMVLVYFVLASIAGWFYGRAYLQTGRIATAALVHTAVDWTWSMFL